MRPLALTHPSATLALLAALTGCATPQYQSRVRLVPPPDAQGQVCVQGCEAQKSACQTNCQSRYLACVKDVEPQVEARYTEALKQYESDLRLYATALRHYEMQLRLEWLNGYPYRYPYRYPYWWNPWPGPSFPLPYPEQVMPTRERVRAKLQASSCHAGCGCLPAYDACFVGCGGQRLVETLCIKNCLPAK